MPISCTEPQTAAEPPPARPSTPRPTTAAPAEELRSDPALAPLREEPAPYPAPVPGDVRVWRRGHRVKMQLRWRPVHRARQYQVQVSPVVTFEHTRIDKRVKRPKFGRGKLEPRIYFWRVRALGRAGKGAFSPVQVLDAFGSTPKTSLRQRRRHRDRKEPAPGTPQAPELIPNLFWERPVDLSVFASAAITVTGTSPPGTRIALGHRAPRETSGQFGLPFTLQRGFNRLLFTAEHRGLVRKMQRDAFFVRPEKLGGIAEKMQEILNDLVKAGERQQALEVVSDALKQRVANARDATTATALQTEVRNIDLLRSQTRRQTDRKREELEDLMRE